MASTDDLKRANLTSILGLTAAEASALSLADLESRYQGNGGGSGTNELGRAVYTGASMTMTAQADVTGVTYTFTVKNRPVEVEVFAPVVSTTTAGGQIMIQVTDENNAEKARGIIAGSSVVSGPTSVRAVERISTPGTYTRKMRLGNNGGGGTITVYGTGTSAAIAPALSIKEV